MDIGSAVGGAVGVTERQLRELGRYRESDAFDPDERLVIELAEAMTATPAEVGQDLRSRVLERFTRGQVAELAAAIAWENHRARLNRALDVRPMGFSDGAVCVLPETPAP